MRIPTIMLALALAAALPALGPARAETATLTVTGQGEASAAPDMATLRAGVETDGATAAAALAANNAAASRIIETLKAAGVAPGDIQTSDLFVQPLYREPTQQLPPQPPEVAGYRVSNTVAVTLHDLGGMGAVLDAVVQAGANRIDSIGFGLTDDSALADEARRRAVAEARRRADVVAEAAGVKLVRVLSIAEGGGFQPQPGMMFRAEASAVPIEAGEATVRAAVTMVWEIAPGG